MSRHRRALRVPSALLAAALLAALPPQAAAEPVAQSCADCCKMVCIEAEILKAKYLREFYRQSASRKGLKLQDYEASEKIAGAAGERLRVAAANGQETCNYYLPDTKDYAESREMQRAGFKPVPDSQGRLALYDYTLTTNTKDCDINATSVELITKVAPCSDIGEAMKTHEQKHIDDCLPRAPKDRTRTPTQTAGDEVRGYDAELAALEQARLVAAEACTKKSCEATKAAWDKSAEMLGADIRKLLEDGAKKKPSASPLARKRGGK